MIACTGQTWNEVGRTWNLPRLAAWSRTIGRLPPLQKMIGHYLGYEMPTQSEPQAQSVEQHAARLMGQLTGM